MPTKEKPVCKLVGGDGNAFVIIGKVCKALRNAGLPEEEAGFRERAMAAGSYDEVLRLAMEYTEVE